EIPLSARVFTLADVWDALSSDRPYRKAWPREKIVAYMREQSGTHFDPRIVDVFLTMKEE
ncbi:MAG: two-component system response regulator, partial [Chloroflexota bacterium]|nr:two-component system response regulator [Chloroflexota bacterium]